MAPNLIAIIASKLIAMAGSFSFRAYWILRILGRAVMHPSASKSSMVVGLYMTDILMQYARQSVQRLFGPQTKNECVKGGCDGTIEKWWIYFRFGGAKGAILDAR